MRQPLRVGVLVRGYELEAWAVTMLERISCSAYATVELLIQVPGKSRKRAGLYPAGMRTNWVHRLVSKLDDMLFHPRPNAFEQRRVERALPELPVVSILAPHDGGSPSGEDLERIEGFQLDVLIDVNLGISEGPLLAIGKYGLWSCDRPDSPGGGIWEVLESEPETAVTIRMRRNCIHPDLILSRAYLRTDRLSPKRNRNGYYWKAAALFPRTLKALWDLGEPDFFRRVRRENASSAVYSGPGKNDPGILRTLAWSARLYWRKVTATLSRSLHREPWALFYQIGCGEFFWRSLFRLKGIVPPRDRFWADPHVVEHEGKHYVFIEEYLYAKKRGHISVLEIDGAGRHTEPTVVLEAEHHLAYPFVFQHSGQFYMIPETRARRRIELYRCVSFPDHWVLARVLIDNINAVDATVISKYGKWWLFTNIKENPGMSLLDELFLFYSDDLLEGDWIPHPRNPVVADVRAARPAGGLFEIDGELYRPAQRCSPRYGYGVVINRVTRMTEHLYEEEPVVAIEPKWDRSLVATHTISLSDKLMVMDGRLKRWRWGS